MNDLRSLPDTNCHYDHDLFLRQFKDFPAVAKFTGFCTHERGVMHRDGDILEATPCGRYRHGPGTQCLLTGEPTLTCAFWVQGSEDFRTRCEIEAKLLQLAV